MRRNTTCLIAAAAMTIGGFAFVTNTQAADNTNNGTVTHTETKTTETNANANTSANATANANANNNNGNNANVPAPDADDIRQTLAKVTDYAFAKKGDFKDVADYFVDADRNRIGSYKPSDEGKLDGRIAEFQKDWKAKYNEDFDLSKVRKDALGDQFAQIVQGEIGEARTAGGKEMPSAEPQNVKGGTPQDLKNSGVNQPDANSNKHFGGDTNREPGRDIATVLVKGSAQASASVQPNQNPPVSANMEMNKQLSVPMIHEAGGWKIDVPDTLDGPKLQTNLLNQLTKFDEDRANWPADKNQAYQEATRHVLEALMETGA